jgi:hypothetical protein
MHRKLFFVVLFLFISFTLSNAQSVKLKNYKANNPDEAAIIELLQDYLDGWKKADKQKILSCFHENSQYMNNNRKYFTKKEMIETNISDWTGSKWYDFYDPKIKIEGDKAIVDLNESLSGGVFQATLQLLRENKKWLIVKHEWKP